MVAFLWGLPLSLLALYSPECVEWVFAGVHIQHRMQPPIATQGLQPLWPTVPSIAADRETSEPTCVNAVDWPA